MGLIDDFVRLPLTRLSAEHEETVKQAVAQCKS
jgi:dihydrodipicolinate synthase/N-acetylneuraminate lyase